jgi:hypothetical protein
MSIGGDLPCLISGELDNPQYHQLRHWFEVEFILNCHENAPFSRQMPLSHARVASLSSNGPKILRDQGLASTLSPRIEPVFPPADGCRDH